MNCRALLTSSLALLLTACASAPKRSFSGPEEAAALILTALDEGKGEEADGIYGDFSSSQVNEQALYPVLYEAARKRFEVGQPDSAADVLELLVNRHPASVGSRESLIYALFLQRALAGSADPDANAKLSEAIVDLRESTTVASPQVDLAETQLRIDQGRVDDARDAFARFLAGWDGQPTSLTLYVEDLNRYLQTH